MKYDIYNTLKKVLEIAFDAMIKITLLCSTMAQLFLNEMKRKCAFNSRAFSRAESKSTVRIIFGMAQLNELSIFMKETFDFSFKYPQIHSSFGCSLKVGIFPFLN